MSKSGRSRTAVIGGAVSLLAVSALAAVTWVWWQGGLGLFVGRESCTAVAGGRTVSLDPEQAGNAATIASVAVRRDLPARAATIALATAYQESDLRNLDYGDRDSLGLFQQRPSQGWGSAKQVLDTEYASNAFYDALVRLDGYAEMPVTEAAQAVQRSGFPEAYAAHEADARVLASTLTGYSPAGFSCTVRLSSQPAEKIGPRGLTPRAAVVADTLEDAFGDLPLGGFAPGGVDSGHVEGSAHYDARAVDVFFRPYGDPGQRRRGWATAHWLVAHADQLGVATVIYDERIWTAGRSVEGWRRYDPGSEDPVLRHLDHVHVDVAE